MDDKGFKKSNEVLLKFKTDLFLSSGTKNLKYGRLFEKFNLPFNIDVD